MSVPDTILDFWFEQSGPSKWFKQSDAFDASIRRQFEVEAIEAAALLQSGGSHPWEAQADSCLALIIMLDQFSRNMYRGTQAMFVWDPLALGVARRAIDKSYDLRTEQARRNFFFLPFMHSENMDDQNRCVYLVERGIDNPNGLHHAKQHRRTIERFGRFPYRNEVLGRVSTREEIAYLKSGGYTP